jgi:hypothetical protein
MNHHVNPALLPMLDHENERTHIKQIVLEPFVAEILTRQFRIIMISSLQL